MRVPRKAIVWVITPASLKMFKWLMVPATWTLAAGSGLSGLGHWLFWAGLMTPSLGDHEHPDLDALVHQLGHVVRGLEQLHGGAVGSHRRAAALAEQLREDGDGGAAVGAGKRDPVVDLAGAGADLDE